MADNKIIKRVVLSDGTAADLDVKYWGGLETSAKQDTLISGTNIKTINGQSIIGEGNIDTIDGIQEVTYNQLNSLIKQNMLITGQQYRITDYVTTTTQENTISAGHRFDIIVTALDESTLSEKVKAIQNDNDDYFDSCNLSAWKIWYSLDNDTERFEWADSENGKGVIYRMIDEWGNDCPYDFKNIMFKRGLNAEGGGIAEGGSEYFFAYCYTFSWEYTFHWEEHENSIMDASIFGNNGDLLNVVGQISGVYGNIIGVYNSYDGDESAQSTKQYLNDIVFFSTYGYESGNYYGCYSNTFCNNCYSNTFGNACHSNNFGNSCHSNNFGNSCHSNNFGNSCHFNNFGNKYYSNTFGDSCSDNTFGDGCYYNIFCNNCNLNTFGNYCYSNNFGNECYENTFGNNCSNNIFDNNCSNNTFGNNCSNNIFGTDCNATKFGDNCLSTKFGNNCYFNEFGNKCSLNEFGSGCCSNKFINECNSNTFGNNCSENHFGSACYSNKFGDNCHSNKFGDNCYSNKFVNYCYSNTFNIACHSNAFGNNCHSNTFFNGCHSNTFCNNCHSNEFGGGCHSNTFGDGCYENVLPNNCLYSTFDTSCYGNKVINEAGTTQKYNIKKGVSEKTIIVDSTFINLEIGVDVWVTSSGELIQEPINEYISLEDIDLMWGEVFSSEGYYSGTSQDSEVINSIGIGDYDEEKEGSDEE